MPLPRSGAPSPGQPTQVGVIEKVGRSLRVESACVSCAKTGDVPKYKVKSKRVNFIIMLRSPRRVYSSKQKTSSIPSLQTYHRVPVLVADVKITDLGKEARDFVCRKSGQWRQVTVAA